MHSNSTRASSITTAVVLAATCASSIAAEQPDTAIHAASREERTATARSPTPAPAPGGAQHGNASFYSHRLTGRKTASGEAYDPNALTAAHRTLPLGTQLQVVNPKNDRSVVVTVNDRGPIPKNRVLDVSSAAADRLGMKKAGVTRVETRVIGKDADRAR